MKSQTQTLTIDGYTFRFELNAELYVDGGIVVSDREGLLARFERTETGSYLFKNTYRTKEREFENTDSANVLEQAVEAIRNNGFAAK